MTKKESIAEVRRIAKLCGYEGVLTNDALDACAEVYLAHLNADGEPSPRTYHRGDNHKRSNLSEILWLLVRTPAFRKWFGSSKVVDENGEPRIMYHGSSQDFDEFKPETIKVSKSRMTLWAGPGFYFTDKRKVADIYAKGGSVKEVFIRLENPLMVDETGNASDGTGRITRDQAVEIMLNGDNSQWLDVGLASELARMDTEDGIAGPGKHGYKEMTREERVRKFVSRLKTDVVKLKCITSAYGAKSQRKMMKEICAVTGHDGVIHKVAPDVTEWVVYDPAAIKSATDNCGDFEKKSAVVQDSISEDKEGSVGMAFGALIGSLSRLVGGKGMDRACAMDIVDRNGRHHQPKAIPEGGQYEEEGQYLTGQAKVEHAIRAAGEGKRGNLLRQHVAPLYAAMGNDSRTRAMIQHMHEDIRGMSKNALMRGMVRHMKEMKRHAENYAAVNEMDKEQFRDWLQQHPEYNIDMNQRLMNESRYNSNFSVKGGYHDDGTGHQKHEAWEEAKWAVGARAIASMIQFQEHADALHGAPDQIMSNEIEHAAENAGAVENNGGAQEQMPQGAGVNVPRENIVAQTPSDNSVRNTLENAVRSEGIIGRMRPEVSTLGNGSFGVSGIELCDENINRISEILGDGYDVRHGLLDVSQNGGVTSYVNGIVVSPRSSESRQQSQNANATVAQSANGVEPQNGGQRQQQFNDRGEHLFFDDLPRDVQEWARGGDIGQFVSSDGNQYRRNEVGGVITQHSPVDSGAQQNVANGGPRSSGTYTDRDGNVHQVQHNPNGLKGAIHESEVGAVQAEMRKAFADAGNDVDGAEEYAHALSHFLGRGNDARSPHPGMRSEGLVKYQLAAKMQTRLQAKLDAFNNTIDGGSESERADAQRDLDATRKAVRKISEICGISNSDLPGGEDYNLVREALHQPTEGERSSANEADRQNLSGLFQNRGEGETQRQNAETATQGQATHDPVAQEQAAQPTDPLGGMSETLRRRVTNELANATGQTTEQLAAMSHENSAAVANATPDGRINGGHIHDAIAARYRLIAQAANLQDQAMSIREQNGGQETDEVRRLTDQAVAIENQARALSHFASRSTGGMSTRDDDGNFTHTNQTVANRMADYLGRAWDRAVERHGEEGAENARGVQGAREAIRTMGGILGFSPEFRDGHVTFNWNGGQRDTQEERLAGNAENAQTQTFQGIGAASPTDIGDAGRAILNAVRNGTGGEGLEAVLHGVPVNEDSIGGIVREAITNPTQERYNAMSRILPAGHPVLRAMMNNAAQRALNRASGTNSMTGSADPQTQSREPRQPETAANQPVQNTPAENNTSFQHRGSLPQGHVLRANAPSREMVRSRSVGMPRNFTRASQVTPQVLADIFARLPARGILDHRNGDVNFGRGRRIPGFEALHQMVTDPSSDVGIRMQARLARANQNNPWVRRLNQAMSVLHPEGATATQARTNAQQQPAATAQNVDGPREPTAQEIESASSRIQVAYGMSHENAVAYVRNAINAAHNGQTDPRYANLASEIFGADHPVTQFIRGGGRTAQAPHQAPQQAAQAPHPSSNVPKGFKVAGDHPKGTAYDSFIDRRMFDAVKGGTTEFSTSSSQWNADRRMMDEGKALYQERKANNQTTPLEDKFHAVGLYSAPEWIPPVTAKQAELTCFACHAVAAMRALFNIPAIPAGNFSGDLAKGKVWAQVRTSAFPGAIPLVNSSVALREMNNAPAGSVIMTTTGGHCWSLQKLPNGNWRTLEVYSASMSNGRSANEMLGNMSFLSSSDLEQARAKAPRMRRAGNISADVSDDQIALARRGAILITPEIAKNCRPEYLTGAVTGIPYNARNMSDMRHV